MTNNTELLPCPVVEHPDCFWLIVEDSAERIRKEPDTVTERPLSGHEILMNKLCRAIIDGWNQRQPEWVSVEDISNMIHDAHMAGQIDAGVDPSYSNAQDYGRKVIESLPPPPQQEG